jgi:hypothetical protein
MTETPVVPEFETFDKAMIADFTAKEEIDKVDHVWAQRIKTLDVGQGFRGRRDESETARMYKLRLNRAARFVYRELEWFPEQKNVKPEDVTSWVIKIRSRNVKGEAEAIAKAKEEAAQLATSQNAQNGTVQGQQTTEQSETVNGSSDQPETASGPRNRR